MNIAIYFPGHRFTPLIIFYHLNYTENFEFLIKIHDINF